MSTSNQLPSISNLLAYPGSAEDSRRRSDQTSHTRQQSQSSNTSPTEHHQHPPLVMQPRHDIQRIDPALFNTSHRTSPVAHGQGPAQRPTVDTSSYPPYPQSHSASTAYPHSAPVPARSQYGEMSPRSAISATAGESPIPISVYQSGLEKCLGLVLGGRSCTDRLGPGPYYSSHQPRVVDPRIPDPVRFHPSLTTPQRGPAPGEELPQPSRPYQSTVSRTRPRGSFHPYDPQSRRGRSDDGEPLADTETTDESHGTQIGRPRAGPGRNYICQSCMKEFSRPSSLKIHEHSHSGAKPFICPRPGCGKNFSVRSNMKRHERGCHLGQGQQEAASASQGEPDYGE